MNGSPKINIFCCASSYDQAEVLKHAGCREASISAISLPCSGKLDIQYLTKAFETGADGAVIMICAEGECRYLEGNRRAVKRAAVVNELLKETGLGEGRIAVIQMTEGGLEKAIGELEDFCLKITQARGAREPVNQAAASNL